MRTNHLRLAIAAFTAVFMGGCWFDNCGGGTPTGGFTVTATGSLIHEVAGG